MSANNQARSNGSKNRQQRLRSDSSVSHPKSAYSIAHKNVKNDTARFISCDNDNVLYYPTDPTCDTLKGVIFNKKKKLVCNNIPHIFEESYENPNIVKLELETNLSDYSIHPLIEGSCIRIWHDPQVPNSQETGKWHQSTNRYIDGKTSNWKNQQLNIAKYLPDDVEYDSFLQTLNKEYIYFFWISKNDESKNIVSYDGDAKCYFIFAQHRKWNSEIKDYTFEVISNIEVNYFENLPDFSEYLENSFHNIKTNIDNLENVLKKKFTDFCTAKNNGNSDALKKAYTANYKELKILSGYFLVNRKNGTCVKIVPNMFTEYRNAIGNEPTIFYRYLKIVSSESEDTLNKFIFINYDKLSQLYEFLTKMHEIKFAKPEIRQEYIKGKNLEFLLSDNTKVVIKDYTKYIQFEA
jgi:hypothetical protein